MLLSAQPTKNPSPPTYYINLIRNANLSDIEL